LLLGSGIGDEDCVVLVLPEVVLTLHRKHADHPERQVTNAQHLANRVAPRKEIVSDRLSDHTHASSSSDVALGEEPTASDGPGPNVGELFIGAPNTARRHPVLVAEDQLAIGSHVGSHRPNRRALGFYCKRILRYQIRSRTLSSPHAALVHRAWPN